MSGWGSIARPARRGGAIARLTVIIERARIEIERRVSLARALRHELIGGEFLARNIVGFARLADILGGGRARLQQRIGLQRLADKGLDLEIGSCQQSDRLLQLRRHHQRLRLAKIQTGAKSHGRRS